jgi:hypothetical protein
LHASVPLLKRESESMKIIVSQYLCDITLKATCQALAPLPFAIWAASGGDEASRPRIQAV